MEVCENIFLHLRMIYSYSTFHTGAIPADYDTVPLYIGAIPDDQDSATPHTGDIPADQGIVPHFTRMP